MSNQDDQEKGARPKQGKSFFWSFLLGALCLIFGVQNLIAAKPFFGVILTLAGLINLFVAYKIWGQRQGG